MEDGEDIESLIQLSRTPQGRSFLASQALVPSLLDRISSSSVQLVLCLRLLRNLCAGEITNQNSFIQYGGADVVRTLLLCSGQARGDVSIEVVHIALQVLANVAGAGEEHQCVVWSCFFADGFSELAKIKDSKIIDTLYMILYTCCCRASGDGSERRMKELLNLHNTGFSIVVKLLQTACLVGYRGDWLQLFISRTCFQGPSFDKLFSELGYLNRKENGSAVEEIKRPNFTMEQAFLLETISEILCQEPYKCNISNDFGFCIFQILKDVSAEVNFNVRGVSSLPTGILVIDILGFSLNIAKDLCALDDTSDETNHALDLYRFLVELLRDLEPPSAIRRSHGTGENQSPEPSINTSCKVCPYKGFRRDVVATIGNGMFGRKHVQDEMRKRDAILLLLQQCTIDDDNPFLREWGIWTLRNLLEGNVENQKVVSDLEFQGSVNTEEISSLGFRVEVDPKSRRPKLFNLN